MTAKRRRHAPRRLPDKHIVLVARGTCEWQDEGGTWHRSGDTDDVSMRADAPPGFHVNAVLQPDNPFLWIGIAAPDTHAARICYATIGGSALFDLARQILRYEPMKGSAR